MKWSECERSKWNYTGNNWDGLGRMVSWRLWKDLTGPERMHMIGTDRQGKLWEWIANSLSLGKWPLKQCECEWWQIYIPVFISIIIAWILLYNVCYEFDVSPSIASPLTFTWPHLRCDVGLEVGKYWKKLITVLCTSGGLVGWRGGLVVGRRTCDLWVAGSRPGRDAAA